jgi:hypothetical protein
LKHIREGVSALQIYFTETVFKNFRIVAGGFDSERKISVLEIFVTGVLLQEDVAHPSCLTVI